MSCKRIRPVRVFAWNFPTTSAISTLPVLVEISTSPRTSSTVTLPLRASSLSGPLIWRASSRPVFPSILSSPSTLSASTVPRCVPSEQRARLILRLDLNFARHPDQQVQPWPLREARAGH